MPDRWPGSAVRSSGRGGEDLVGHAELTAKHRYVWQGLHRCAAAPRRVLEGSQPALDRRAVSRTPRRLAWREPVEARIGLVEDAMEARADEADDDGVADLGGDRVLVARAGG